MEKAECSFKVLLIINHLSLISKFHIYKARDSKKMNFETMKKKKEKIRNKEKDLAQNNINKVAGYKINGRLLNKFRSFLNKF